MVTLALARGARVLLIGMRMPPNYGERYTDEFHGMYTDIAQRHALALVPFLMDAVALRPELIQAVGLHPTSRRSRCAEYRLAGAAPAARQHSRRPR